MFWKKTKKESKKFNVEKATVSIKTSQGETYKISRVGNCGINRWDKEYVTTGRDLVIFYMCSCRNFIETDEGVLIPVHCITKVDIKVESYEKELV